MAFRPCARWSRGKSAAPWWPANGNPPEPGPGQVPLRVLACAICRTDLHVVDGDLPDLRPPIIPGHEIVGEAAACGPYARAAR